MDHACREDVGPGRATDRACKLLGPANAFSSGLARPSAIEMGVGAREITDGPSPRPRFRIFADPQEPTNLLDEDNRLPLVMGKKAVMTEHNEHYPLVVVCRSNSRAGEPPPSMPKGRAIFAAANRDPAESDGKTGPVDASPEGRIESKPQSVPNAASIRSLPITSGKHRSSGEVTVEAANTPGRVVTAWERTRYRSSVSPVR